MKHSALSLITRHGHIWGIERQFAEEAMLELSNLDLHLHLDEVRDARGGRFRQLQELRDGNVIDRDARRGRYRYADDDKEFEFADGCALFRVTGVMTKHGSSWGDSTSTEYTAQLIRQARKDRDVVDGVVVFDTPGGSINGLTDFCAEIAAFAREKRMVAYVQDLCCSAGVWAACSCNAIFANSVTADYGSLGVRMVVRDYSEMFAKAGVRVIPIDTGEFKSAGEPGTRITKAHVGDWQRLVDQTGDEFVAALMQGRGMSEDAVREVFTGQVWNAADAMKLGLIDGIAPMETVLADMRSGKIGAPRSAGKTRRYAASEIAGGKEDEMADGRESKPSLWEQFKALLGGEEAASTNTGAAEPEAIDPTKAEGKFEAMEQRMNALEAENKALKDQMGGVEDQRKAAEDAAQQAKSAGVDAWVKAQKEAGRLLPAAEAGARAIYEKLGEKEATAFLEAQGTVAPFIRPSKPSTEGEGGGSHADDLDPYKIYAARGEAVAGKVG